MQIDPEFRWRKILGPAALVLTLAAFGGIAEPQTAVQTVDGRWDASITQGGVAIPFRLDISGAGDHLVGRLCSFDEIEARMSSRFNQWTAAAVPISFILPATPTLAGQHSDSPSWAERSTGLTWATTDNGSGVSWHQVQRYCSELRIGGRKD